MIYLSDFQPLSVTKIKKFSSTTGFLPKIFSDKVHTILIEEVTVQTTLRDGASFRRLTSIIIAMFPVTSRQGHVGLFISVVGKNKTWLDVSY